MTGITEMKRYLRNQEPLARVAIVYSQQTATFYGGPRSARQGGRSSARLLSGAGGSAYPFEMVHDRLLDADHLQPYRALILPNIAALSDRQCSQLHDYVMRGGSLVATHETSLYNEWGVRREDFGLASVFGVTFDGSVEGPTLNSYLALQKDPQNGRFHPLLNGFTDANRIINGVHRVRVRRTDANAHSPLTLIPYLPRPSDGRSFSASNQESGARLSISGEIGNGRVVYFPFDLDRTFWEVLDVDHSRLLRNAVLWAHQEPQPLEVQGPGLLDVSIWRQKSSLTVHVVNLTNPMAMKGPVREIIPVSEQLVRISLLSNQRPHRARLLVAGKEVPFRRRGNSVELQIPSIGVHEVVALNFSS